MFLVMLRRLRYCFEPYYYSDTIKQLSVADDECVYDWRKSWVVARFLIDMHTPPSIEKVVPPGCVIRIRTKKYERVTAHTFHHFNISAELSPHAPPGSQSSKFRFVSLATGRPFIPVDTKLAP